ncbi:hypothetical protein ABK040_007161 [Willaertia magna]
MKHFTKFLLTKNNKTSKLQLGPVLKFLNNTLPFQITPEEWNKRIEKLEKNTVILEKQKTTKRNFLHRFLFSFTAVFSAILFFFYINFRYSEYSLQKIQYLMLQSLQREGAQTLVNLQLYGRKPEKDIRETRTLNREKFYGNRELSRVNFEKASYYQQLKRFENEKKESNN